VPDRRRVFWASQSRATFASPSIVSEPPFSQFFFHSKKLRVSQNAYQRPFICRGNHLSLPGPPFPPRPRRSRRTGDAPRLAKLCRSTFIEFVPRTSQRSCFAELPTAALVYFPDSVVCCRRLGNCAARLSPGTPGRRCAPCIAQRLRWSPQYRPDPHFPSRSGGDRRLRPS
jgi:hypothetical protein